MDALPLSGSKLLKYSAGVLLPPVDDDSRPSSASLMWPRISCFAESSRSYIAGWGIVYPVVHRVWGSDRRVERCLIPVDVLEV